MFRFSIDGNGANMDKRYRYMKKLLPVILALLAVSTFPQTSDLAASTYANNGKLISLTNILGLSDCPTKNVVGKVKKIKIRGNFATFRLGGRDEKINIEVNLDRLSAADRRVVFLDMIRSRYILRVAGYSCNPDGIIAAFSLYRE